MLIRWHLVPALYCSDFDVRPSCFPDYIVWNKIDKLKACINCIQGGAIGMPGLDIPMKAQPLFRTFHETVPDF